MKNLTIITLIQIYNKKNMKNKKNKSNKIYAKVNNKTWILVDKNISLDKLKEKYNFITKDNTIDRLKGSSISFNKN